MPLIEFPPGQEYRGEGISRGLARGILVSADGRNITGEGMGIGAVALKDARFSYFSRECTTTVHGPDRVEKTCLIDTRMLWGRKDSPSASLTRFMERVNNGYMRWPVLQYLLPVGSSAKNLLGLRPVFEPIRPVAEARFIYRITGNRIDVSCTVRPFAGRLPSVYILSELAADSFTHAFSGGTVTRPPSGWVRHEPGSDLYDPVHRLRFTFSPPSSSEGTVPPTVWWGREHTRNLRWAGYSLEFPEGEESGKPVFCTYAVCLVEESP